jgi:hypothetical protein
MRVQVRRRERFSERRPYACVGSGRSVPIASLLALIGTQVRLDSGVDRQDRVLVLDEVTEVGILLIANRALESATVILSQRDR